MLPKVRVSVNTDYLSKEVRMKFSVKVDEVGMDPDMAIRVAKELEKRAIELQGKLVFPVTQ